MKVWKIQEEVVGLVGEQRLSNGGRFDLTLFKAFFKLIKASGLAVAPQTLNAVSLMKQDPMNQELYSSSSSFCKFKDQFLMDGGLKQLQSVMQKSFSSSQFEVYFYCLGCLPPLLFNSYFLFPQDKVTEWVKSHDEIVSEVRKQGLVEQLSGNLKTLFDDKSPELRYCAPLLLGLKALAAADGSLKSKLIDLSEIMKTLLQVVF